MKNALPFPGYIPTKISVQLGVGGDDLKMPFPYCADKTCFGLEQVVVRQSSDEEYAAPIEHIMSGFDEVGNQSMMAILTSSTAALGVSNFAKLPHIPHIDHFSGPVG